MRGFPKLCRLRQQLAEAEYNLSETTIRAPTAGYATQVVLRVRGFAGAVNRYLLVVE